MGISPSKLASLITCPCYEEGESDPAFREEGIALHRAVETSNPAGLDDEQEQLVLQAMQYRDGLVAGHVNPTVINELRLESESSGLNRGIVDCAILSDRCEIIDYKFGSQPVADAEYNWQAKYYAAKIFLELTESLSAFCKERRLTIPQYKEVTVHMVSPRIRQVTFHTFTPDVVQEIKDKRDEVERKRRDPFKIPNPEDPGLCNLCRYAAGCPALKMTAVELYSRMTDLRPRIEDLQLPDDPVIRAKYQQAAELVSVWGQGVKADNLKYVLEGGEIPGFKLVTRAGSKEIVDHATLLERVVDKLGLNTKDVFGACKTSVNKITTLLAESEGITIEEAKERVGDLIGDLLIDRDDVRYLRQEKRKGAKAMAPT